MIVYDWKPLKILPVDKILAVLLAISIGNMRSSPKEVLKVIASFKNSFSFLNGDKNLSILRAKHSQEEIYQYLELASKRSYSNYKETGSLKLPTYYLKGLYEIHDISLNSALLVDKDEIIFKYEEI